MGGGESSIKKRNWLLKKTHGKTQSSSDKSTLLLDLNRSIREYLLSLNREQLNYLSSTYSQLSEERIYYNSCMKSRPCPPTIYQDFSDLLDYKYNSDVEIQLPAANFLAHKPLLIVRSGYFATHLKSNVVKLSLLDVLGFSEVLRWIYTGENSMETSESNLPSFLHLTSNSLPNSLLQLYSTRRYADCVLIWSSVLNQPAHVCVLSRSPLLRNLLSKKKQLVLDSNVIPFKYSNCLLYFIYTDQLDLNLINESMATTMPPPFGIQNTSTGNVSLDLLSNLFELYYCGQFLELDALVYAVETVIESQINESSWIRILSWAVESYGSIYIKRCCIIYMQEYWWFIAQRPEFYTVPIEIMEELLSSDFTQCPESELVDSVLRWGAYNSITLNSTNLTNFMRFDYITNQTLLKQVTKGMECPSLLITSRPRYWEPIHKQIREMVGDNLVGGGTGVAMGNVVGLNLESIDDFQQINGAVGGGQDAQVIENEEESGSGGGGGEVVMDPDLFASLLNKYDQLVTDATIHNASSPNDNICHWLRLQSLREYGLPDTYEKCLISAAQNKNKKTPSNIDPHISPQTSPSQHQQHLVNNIEHNSTPRTSSSQDRHHRHHNRHNNPRDVVTATASLHRHHLRHGNNIPQLASSLLLIEQNPLPDIASNIIDPIVNLDLGDRFKH